MPFSLFSKRKSLDIKNDVELSEIAPERDLILERYELIRDKSVEERREIEKSLVRKLDFKFLPMVTAMLMMKLVIYSIQYDLPLNCSQLS
jgi:predicted nucleic acid-binding protein